MCFAALVFVGVVRVFSVGFRAHAQHVVSLHVRHVLVNNQSANVCHPPPLLKWTKIATPSSTPLYSTRWTPIMIRSVGGARVEPEIQMHFVFFATAPFLAHSMERQQ
ncbi:hypothetical protein MRX96_037084 [Rhipicephalus microplus]